MEDRPNKRVYPAGPYHPEDNPNHALAFHMRWVEGKSVQRIAETMRVTRRTIYNWLRKYGEWYQCTIQRAIHAYRAGCQSRFDLLFSEALQQYEQSKQDGRGRGDVNWWKAMVDINAEMRALWGLDAAKKMEHRPIDPHTVRIGPGGVAAAKQEIQRRLLRSALGIILPKLTGLVSEEQLKAIKAKLTQAAEGGEPHPVDADN